MSRGGHAIVAVAIGGLIGLVGHHPTLGVATALAAQVPDRIEGVLGYSPTGRRFSVIPHRTLSHWPWGYLALLIIGLLLPLRVGTPFGAYDLGDIIAGIGAGALIHLALDILSPSGIPLLSPFGQRTSIGPYDSGGHPYLYRTSTPEEWPIVAPFGLLCLFEAIAFLAHLSISAPHLNQLIPHL